MGDINAINKQTKAWLYADLLEKPEELALYRQPVEGGLGLHHVQLRALAYQISCFLETSCNPVYKRNQYHEALLQYHVLGEDIPVPDPPPYFKGEFFPTIRRLHATPLSLTRVSLKEIYRFLIEEFTIQEEEPGTRTLKPFRTELANPETPWDLVWPSSRQYMLGPSLCSFLFKLLHQILPTAQRVARILPNQSPSCTRCRLETPETLQHALLECPGNQGVGTVLHNGLKKYLPNLTRNMILTLNYTVEEDLQFSLVWTTAAFLSTVWNLRTEKKKVDLIRIRAEMEASCRLLRESRLTKTTEMLSQIF